MGRSLSARHCVRWSRGIAILALPLVALGAQAEGLVFHPQADSLAPHAPVEYGLSHVHAPGNSIRLFGDYYFFDPAHSNMGPLMSSLVGGFRASTGVAGLGQTMSLFELQPDNAQNLPYMGLGYSHFWFTGQLSLNADFGLTTQNASAAGRGRGLFNGTPSLDDITRDLRWAPVMAVNVSYSF